MTGGRQLLADDGRRRSRPDSEQGTSIPEVIVATMLLAVGVMAVVGTIGVALRATSSGERRQVATRIAEAEIEQLRSIPYDEVGISPASRLYQVSYEGRPTVTGTVNRVEPLTILEEDGLTYYVLRYVTWRPITAGGSRISQGYKSATISVIWIDGRSLRAVRLDTGLYEAGSNG